MKLGASLGTNRDRRLWSVLLLLFAAVLLPTACALWLIGDSIAKQRQIAAQQLAAAYRSQLKLVAERLDEYWQAQAAGIGDRVHGTNPAAEWAAVIREGLLDSLVLYDSAGRLSYPTQPAVPVDTEPQSSEWVKARILEDRPARHDILAAAAAYGAIAKNAKDTGTIARALQAQARSLRQGGREGEAVSLIFGAFTGRKLLHAQDAQGRSIAADALLMAIHLTKAPDARRTLAAELLHRMLTDYDSVAMPSPQRLFLMKEMRAAGLPAALSEFPTLAAEEMAATAIETGLARAFDGILRPSGMRDVWMLGSRSGRVAGMLRSETVKQRITAFVATQTMPPGVQAVLLEHGDQAERAIDMAPAGAYLPQWRLGLMTSGEHPYSELDSQRTGLYVWAGLLVILAGVALSLLAGRLIHRQMRLASLKSDLVATVSHELKTPLASTRLLLDTLLQQDELDPVQTREYLELMDKENTRLTHMIENFLAFSRLERNRYNFRFGEASPAEIADRAIEAFADRAAEPNVKLSVEIAPGLPLLHADPGALSTALINLLDNAYKYTTGEKRIALRVYRHNGGVCFEVRDNGIGVPKSEASRVFRDFYQVDNRLARTIGGSGLGLSIVKFIVDAHNGTVSLDSQVGEGSTFQVAVPSGRS